MRIMPPIILLQERKASRVYACFSKMHVQMRFAGASAANTSSSAHRDRQHYEAPW